MEASLYVVAVLVSSGLAVSVATWLWSHDLDRAARVFALMLSLYPLVGLFVVGEIVATDRTLAIAFFVLHAAVVAVIVPLWFLFAIRYTDRGHWLTRPRLLAFGGLLAVLAAIQLTDPIHGLVYEYAITTDPFHHVAATPTPLFPIFALFQTVPYLGAMGLLGYHAAVEAPAKRKRTLALIVGFLPPLFTVAGWNAGVIPGPLDGASNIASAWSLAFVAWAVFRYQLFDILSLARKRVFEDLRDPIVVVDPDRRILDVNRAAVGTFPALADADSAKLEERLPPIVEDDTIVQSFTDYGEESREFEVSISPLVTAGDTQGYGLVIRDVTAINRQIRDLKQQSAQLERFASTLSHDLRNPLNVANGRSELALETGDLSHLEATLDAQQRMGQIIDDVLALSREGRTIDEPERVRLKPVFEDAWASTATPSATEEIEPDADVVVYADPGRLQNVFENLIRNAVEHASPTADDGATDDEPSDDQPAGRDATGVTITLGRHAEGFYVEDDGPGVPADERERVFEYAYTTEETGTGLGLAIVDAIASAHGWSVSMTEGSRGGARVVFSGVDIVEAGPEAVEEVPGVVTDGRESTG
ncbi:histidine kinase N-terminal 7TM domain-containing protein [Halorhabdus sp. BNX81]|uniref:sensor histidine kinase n=1 Tax=Halorhabdus sp. BNX81 TaxID=2980181 RepID=UPI0023DD6061|nr:histidine kinase N-terminal 7TM domain-containing protein [Halorhabdus sp. BNX81]